MAQPASPWARRRYSPGRLERARARYATDRGPGRWRGQIADLVTGAPSAAASPQPPPADDLAALAGVVSAS
jgi:hypothetical protein